MGQHSSIEDVPDTNAEVHPRLAERLPGSEAFAVADLAGRQAPTEEVGHQRVERKTAGSTGADDLGSRGPQSLSAPVVPKAESCELPEIPCR